MYWAQFEVLPKIGSQNKFRFYRDSDKDYST